MNTRLANSNTEARDLLIQQAITINGRACTDSQVLGSTHSLHGHYIVLQRGAKSHALLLWE